MNKTYYDGSFEYYGEEIFYHIDNELKHIKYKYSEPIKAQRFIYFFNATGESEGFYPYYDDIEQVTNISKWDAATIFKKMKEENE